MRYIDISQTIVNGMKKYPSDPPVKIRQFKSLNKGDSCNLKELSFGNHVGTHVDAPGHILKRGARVDKLRLRDLVCNVFVTSSEEFFGNRLYERVNLDNITGILFKNIKGKTGITIEQANILLKCGIKVIGTEDMTIEMSSDKTHPVHRLLLGKKIIIIEGLNLKRVRSGCYKLMCLPLKIKAADGAPARAILAYD